ncbi:hypothetical protein O0L34_g7978 [Tuta absoluta]|nr:hypothetical protein O0L34_g7978 [Tuta absoluta]
MQATGVIKENRSWRDHEPLPLRWMVLGVLVSVAGLALVAHMDRALPAPKPPPPQSPTTVFSGILAHEFLVNLTSIGPRVAGSYENEVLAVNNIVSAVKRVAAGASPHNHVELDLHRASGAFPLKFFDGMNNIYRDVQSVVARVRGAGGGGKTRGKRSALLLNCHFDTVVDSPGASDDGAGCAVLIEVLRALASTPHPLKHDAIFLFNGAEENIMQASHAFVTTHKWAKYVRAFINIEACGAGGREVLFQAGPHDPWIMEVYGGAVPHPFASSLAQELFESGLIPADTDFRIFRDFGKLSGVDLAWSSNGYVYHTHLDTAERVPPASLQRTGDNVLALTHGLLSSESIESELDLSSRQPVFFDVLGLWLVCCRAPLAAALAMATLLLAALVLATDARHASAHLYVPRGAWWSALVRASLALCVAHACGLAASAAVALVLHAAGARLAFYSRPGLLAPLYALPALATAWWILRRWVRGARCGAVRVRGWWAARLVSGAVLAGWGAALALCMARGLRSGFLPLHWALLLGASSRAHQLCACSGAGSLVWWCCGALLPLLQTWYLALGMLQMFVPIVGRAGTAPVPPDVMLAVSTGALSLAASSWLLPLAAASRGVSRLVGGAAITAAAAAALVALTPLGSAYTAVTPQRYMVFHTRRTIHTGAGAAGAGGVSGGLRHEDIYWAPHVDANSPYSLRDTVPEIAQAKYIEKDCELYPYCGVPYFLPVIQFISRGYTHPAAAPPDARVALATHTDTLGAYKQAVHLNITGPTHIVLIISPIEGAEVSWCSYLNDRPREAAPWNRRKTYFLTLHDARASSHAPGAGQWQVTFHIAHRFETPPEKWASLSVAGHKMAANRSRELTALFAKFPEWSAPTGWDVHMHLFDV